MMETNGQHGILNLFFWSWNLAIEMLIRKWKFCVWFKPNKSFDWTSIISFVRCCVFLYGWILAMSICDIDICKSLFTFKTNKKRNANWRLTTKQQNRVADWSHPYGSYIVDTCALESHALRRHHFHRLFCLWLCQNRKSPSLSSFPALRVIFRPNQLPSQQVDRLQTSLNHWHQHRHADETIYFDLVLCRMDVICLSQK